MSWIGGMMGAISQGLKDTGRNREIRGSNTFYGNLYHPRNLNQYAGRINPFIYAALGYTPPKGWGGGGFGLNPLNSPIYGDLLKIAQGQDISPYLLNQPLNEINRGYGQNLAKFQSLVGRQNAGGGMANLYGLANLGGRTNARANLFQNYGQWREQQRRSDINWLLGQYTGAQGNAMNLLQAYGNKWQKPSSFATVLGNNIQAYMAGAGGGMGGMFGGMGGGGGGAGVTGSSGAWAPPGTSLSPGNTYWQ